MISIPANQSHHFSDRIKSLIVWIQIANGKLEKAGSDMDVLRSESTSRSKKSLTCVAEDGDVEEEQIYDAFSSIPAWAPMSRRSTNKYTHSHHLTTVGGGIGYRGRIPARWYRIMRGIAPRLAIPSEMLLQPSSCSPSRAGKRNQ